MGGVIVNKVIVAGLLAFLLTASTNASAYYDIRSAIGHVILVNEDVCCLIKD